MKRTFDLIISIVLAFILSPIIIITALLVRMKLGKPVLFKQQRIGYKCKVFTVYKFRTMIDAKDQYGNDLPDSKRITPFGRGMRKMSLDEFPQLWNVIKGDMSLVGPRPLLVKYLPYYTLEENKRHLVKPGITGLAQVSGRNRINWDMRLELDVKYYKERSMLMDFRIIMQTFMKVLKSEDVVEVQREEMLDLDVERRNKEVQSTM